MNWVDGHWLDVSQSVKEGEKLLFLAVAGEADAENERRRQSSQRSWTEAHTRNRPTAQGNPHSVMIAFRYSKPMIECGGNGHLALTDSFTSSLLAGIIANNPQRIPKVSVKHLVNP